MYNINYAKLEGIRGVNKPFEIKFSEGLTVIHGPNGTGKSSIIQGIEWCIAGSIPYMRGGDYAKEDAVVNVFTKTKRALVELSFKGPKEFKVSRTKKLARSTTTGQQKLLLDADRSYLDSEAEAFMENALDLGLGDVSRSKFLHQETIRDALTYKPTERSAVIEKLLGTYDIKEFSKSLDTKRLISSELKRIDDTIEALQRDRIQFVLNLRHSLENTKDALLRKGYNESQLNLAYTINELEGLRNSIDKIAGYFNHTFIQPVISPEAESLIKINRRINEDVNYLDRRRMEKLQKLSHTKTEIETLSGTYRTALEHFREIEALNVEELRAESERLKKHIAELNEMLIKTQSKLTLIPPRVSTYQASKNSYIESLEAFEKLVSEYGNEEEIKGRVKQLQIEANDIKKKLQRFSGQQRLLNLAVQYIQETEPTECPVCSQRIDPLILVSDLQMKVSKDISDQINETNTSKKKIDEEIETLTNIHAKMIRDRDAVKKLESNLMSAKNNLASLIGSFDENTDLNVMGEALIQGASEAQSKLSDAVTRRRELDEKIMQHINLNNEITDTLNSLRTKVGKVLEGEPLLQAAIDTVSTIEYELRELSETTPIDEIRNKSVRLSDVLSYLSEEERTENAEKELPSLNHQLETLKAKKLSLAMLSTALTSIGGIIAEYQKMASLKQIKELEDTMNDYYSTMMGHPYFSNLKVDIEREEPLQFSFRATSERESTYIPTRFSTAQLNIAALSVFISNSKLMAGGLPLIILDDPTQNMDTEHKQNFAKLVSKLADDFQVIVATEDDEARDFLEQQRPDGTYYELSEWGTNGPNIVG